MKRGYKFFEVYAMLIIACFIIVLVQNEAFSQNDAHYLVRTGDIILESIPLEGRYRFKEFEEAQVVFLGKNPVRGKLNYHLLYGEMQFLNTKGDTVSLSHEQMLQKISFNNCIFYYDPGKKHYLERISGGEKIMLARHLTLRASEDHVTAIDGYVSTLDPNLSQVVYGLDNRTHTSTLRDYYVSNAQHTMSFRTFEEFYFIDKNLVVWPVNKRSLKRIFSGHKRMLAEFLSKKSINFGDVGDLKKLITF